MSVSAEPASTLGGGRSWQHVRVILRHFRKDVRKRRRLLAAGGGFGFVYALARVAEPWPLKVVFDHVLLEKPAEGFWVYFFTPFGTGQYEILAAAALLLALVGVVRGVAYYYEDFLLSKAAQEIVFGIRTKLYRHLHRLPLGFHQRRRTGDTLVRLSSDIVLMRDLLVDAIVNIGTGAILIVLMLAVMAIIDPVLALVSLVVMPLVLVSAFVYGRRIRGATRKQRKREGQVAAAMHEALSSIAVVQLHGASEREHERFQAINRRSLKQGVHASRLEARMNRAVEVTLGCGVALMLALGTARALQGALSPGELIVFVSYLRAAYRPLQRASKTVQRAAKALAAAERVVEILETEPTVADLPGAKEAPSLAGRIEFENVSFEYTPGRPVLSDVSISIGSGNRVAVVGSSGSGKSTLLGLVPRLFDSTSGRVTVDGVDVRELTLESLRAQISLVLQEPVLFGLSIAENIRYGCPDASDEEVVAAARAARVDEFASQLPEGFDSIVGERGASLSGGQRQRIALARALVRRSPILLLDEPTNELDFATERDVNRLVRELMARSTTLLVTHDMDLVRDADEIIVLDEGRVVARGGYADLLGSSPHFRRLTASSEATRPLPLRAVPVTRSADGPRALFYSHNGVGVGHLQRQLDLAKAYRERIPDSGVLLATGSHGFSMFEFPDGIDVVKLPSLAMVDRNRNWRPRDLPVPTETVTAMRADMLEQAVKHFAPDLLVADFMPAGPYGELLPALEELARRGGTAVAGFRDVIDEPEYVRALWAETGIYDVLRRHYASICIYGDPLMVDFAAAYGLDGDLAARVRYCGYLGRDPQPEPGDLAALPGPRVLATSGGGVDGSRGLEAFIAAAGALRPRVGGTWTAVSGPLLALAEHQRLVALGERTGVRVLRTLPHLRAQVAHSDCVVAMAGYNTVCDILSFRRRAVLVPRSSPNREQTLRARKLEEWGLVDVVPLDDLSPVSLGAAIADALAHSDVPPAPVPLDGIERALDSFHDALEITRAA